MRNNVQLDSGSKKKATSVWLPFASGNVVEVELSCFPAESGTRPVTAYPVHMHKVHPDLVRTVDAAAEAAYRLARERGDLGESAHSIGYLLKGLPVEAGVAGESGGLAMAIAVYCALAGRNIGRVAATGRLVSLQAGGEIGGVDGVPEKVAGALEVLAGGDVVLYPRENEADLDEGLRADCLNRNIRLLSVASVREALQLLCGEETSEEALPGKRRRVAAMVMAVVVFGGLAWGLTMLLGPGAPQQDVAGAEKPAVVTVQASEADSGAAAGESGRDTSSQEVVPPDDGQNPADQAGEVPAAPPRFAQGFE